MSETGPQSQPDDAMMDLLIKQVTEGLSPAEQRALDVLDSAVAGEYLRDFEQAVAAITLAGTVPSEPSPALRARLEQLADTHTAAIGRGPAPADNILPFKPPGANETSRSRSAPRSASLGWFAAAACLLLALFAWFRAPQAVFVPAPVQAALPPPVAPQAVPDTATPTLAEQRAALVARSETLKVTLGATKDPGSAGVTGDAVWDPVTQKGFLHFVGLATNDPRVRQYQLWIFDGERDQRYPVDGGVFDIPADSAEVIIPIRAALPIHLVKAFAVTVEKPGGVVVSGRAHVVALGAAS